MVDKIAPGHSPCPHGTYSEKWKEEILEKKLKKKRRKCLSVLGTEKELSRVTRMWKTVVRGSPETHCMNWTPEVGKTQDL